MTDVSEIKRGDVWQVNLDPSIGDEIRKKRPCVVMTADGLGRLRLKTIIPITDPLKSGPEWHVNLRASKQNGLTKDSVADTFQIRSLSANRFIKKLGKLSAQEMEEIEASVMIVLDIR